MYRGWVEGHGDPRDGDGKEIFPDGQDDPRDQTELMVDELEERFSDLQLLLMASVCRNWITHIEKIFQKRDSLTVNVEEDADEKLTEWKGCFINGRMTSGTLNHILWTLSNIKVDLKLDLDLSKQELPLETLEQLWLAIHSHQAVLLRGVRRELVNHLFLNWHTGESKCLCRSCLRIGEECANFKHTAEHTYPTHPWHK